MDSVGINGEWIRLLGGWAVVVIVLRWFMIQYGARDKARDQAFTALLDQMGSSLDIHKNSSERFEAARAEEAALHGKILVAMSDFARNEEILTRAIEKLSDKMS